jgi:hypothetical protein
MKAEADSAGCSSRKAGMQRQEFDQSTRREGTARDSSSDSGSAEVQSSRVRRGTQPRQGEKRRRRQKEDAASGGSSRSQSPLPAGADGEAAAGARRFRQSAKSRRKGAGCEAPAAECTAAAVGATRMDGVDIVADKERRVAGSGKKRLKREKTLLEMERDILRKAKYQAGLPTGRRRGRPPGKRSSGAGGEEQGARARRDKLGSLQSDKREGQSEAPAGEGGKAGGGSSSSTLPKWFVEVAGLWQVHPFPFLKGNYKYISACVFSFQSISTVP